MNLRSVLQILILCSPLQCLRAEEWKHHTVLDKDGRYHLYWNPPADKGVNGEIVFKLEVRTKGYVGFGLSSNGGMTGSDMVTGWVKDGQSYFQDRHGIGNTLPRLDRNQNWILTEAQENETHTTLQFRRKLNTCDEEDMVIDDSTMRVIYAFSEQDPMTDCPFYHSSNRGVKSVNLLQAPPKPQNIEDPSLLQWDVRSPKVEISSSEDTYWYKIFKTPSVSKKHHIVQVQPLIQEGNEQFVYHIKLHECVGTESEKYESYAYSRGYGGDQPEIPDAFRNCSGERIVIWAMGGGGILIFPEHAGLPLTSDAYYMLDMHYFNPQRTPGVIDDSGLRIYYTPNVRKYDAGMFKLGAKPSPTMFIPPGQETYVVAGHSDPECLRSEMPAEGIQIIATFSHAHQTARRLKARHFRGNKELPPIVVEKNFDFNYQEYRYLKDEITILPGDQITMECTYDSSGRTTATFGGSSASDEMCLSTVLYYPRMDIESSRSEPTLSTIISSLPKANLTVESSVLRVQLELSDYNWTNVDIRELQDVLRYSEHRSECVLANGQTVTMENLVSYPRNFEPCVETDVACNEVEPEWVIANKPFSLAEEFTSSEEFSEDNYYWVF